VKNYEKEYLLLTNRLVDLYHAWTDKIGVFNKMNEVKEDLGEPLKLIHYLEKQLNFATNDKLAEYIRRIIVSANHLQRRYFPESVNEKYEPDKVYERIIKFILDLENANKKLKDEIRDLKALQKGNSQPITAR
jgi:hypothetical protein